MVLPYHSEKRYGNNSRLHQQWSRQIKYNLTYDLYIASERLGDGTRLHTNSGHGKVNTNSLNPSQKGGDTTTHYGQLKRILQD